MTDGFVHRNCPAAEWTAHERETETDTHTHAQKTKQQRAYYKIGRKNYAAPDELWLCASLKVDGGTLVFDCDYATHTRLARTMARDIQTPDRIYRAYGAERIV